MGLGLRLFSFGNFAEALVYDPNLSFGFLFDLRSFCSGEAK